MWGYIVLATRVGRYRKHGLWWSSYLGIGGGVVAARGTVVLGPAVAVTVAKGSGCIAAKLF